MCSNLNPTLTNGRPPRFPYLLPCTAHTAACPWSLPVLGRVWPRLHVLHQPLNCWGTCPAGAILVVSMQAAAIAAARVASLHLGPKAYPIQLRCSLWLVVRSGVASLQALGGCARPHNWLASTIDGRHA